MGYGVGLLFGLLGRFGLMDDVPAQIDEAIDVLRQGNELYSLERDAPENETRSLARRLYGRLPMIYCGSALAEAAAHRTRAQINENAKTMAFVSRLPEMNHNEIVGWEVAHAARDLGFVLLYRDASDHPRVVARFEATRDALGDRVRDWETVTSKGSGALARLMSLIQFGDYLSVYMAGEYGMDPMAIDLIDELKRRLGETS